MQGLKEKRIQNKMTRKELGKRVGLSDKSIYQYEIGGREPSFTTLKKFSKLFKCSVDELL